MLTRFWFVEVNENDLSKDDEKSKKEDQDF